MNTRRKAATTAQAETGFYGSAARKLTAADFAAPSTPPAGPAFPAADTARCPDCGLMVDTLHPRSRADVTRLRSHSRVTGETSTGPGFKVSDLCAGSWKFAR
jgi:hypothetical protein